MRFLLCGGRLSVAQPRTDDKEAPMNRQVEALRRRTATHSEHFDTVIIGGGQAGRSACRRGGAHPRQNRGRARRVAPARGRSRPRRCQCDLVHRVPAGLRMDRPPDLRRRRRTDARSRRDTDRARPVLRRPVTSSLVGGVGRDTEHVAKHLASRQRNARSPVFAGERTNR